MEAADVTVAAVAPYVALTVIEVDEYGNATEKVKFTGLTQNSQVDLAV